MESLDPQVDVVIGVHNPARPIARAVGSILDHTMANVRITVVCHGVESDRVAAQLRGLAADKRVRLVEFFDDVRSPSGPFNYGVAMATAPFISIMGSDDELGPGAIDSWLKVQARDHAVAVIPRLAHASGVGVATPPVRPFRTRQLDAVRDRLLYRSAPLGLISREVFGDLRLEEDLSAGGDIAYSVRLWTSNECISFDVSGPPYIIHDDAGDRVTYSVRPVAEELRFLRELLAKSLISELKAALRIALAVKLFRVHLFGAIFNRRELSRWIPEDRADLRAAALGVLHLAPECIRYLSRADRSVIDAILAPAPSPTESLIELALARRRFGTIATVLPRDLRYTFAREAPLRMMFASLVVQRRAGFAAQRAEIGCSEI